MTRLGLIAVLLASLAACSPLKDLDHPCRLITADASADAGFDFVPANSPLLDPRLDFIAVGDSDCESNICIRLAFPATGFYDDADGLAHGRCSGTCTSSGDCSGSVAQLSCEQLGPDAATLKAYCDANPTVCKAQLGGETNASYCVDPAASSGAGG